MTLFFIFVMIISLKYRIQLLKFVDFITIIIIDVTSIKNKVDDRYSCIVNRANTIFLNIYRNTKC